MDFLGVLLSGLILVFCVIDDLKTRKIHNKLILILFPLALAGAFFLKDHSLVTIAIASLLSLIISIPLYIGKVVGGGDLKCFFVFSMTVTWMEVWQVFFYSLPWVLMLGVLKLTFDKKIKNFLSNLVSILKFKSLEQKSLHTIPFSVGLLFGWMTLFFLQKVGI